MKLMTTLEFRKTEEKSFTGSDGKELKMTIVTFLDEDENKIKLTIQRDADVSLISLVKGRMYTLELATNSMSLYKDNDLATLYLTKFKLVSVVPFAPVGSSQENTKGGTK